MTGKNTHLGPAGRLSRSRCRKGIVLVAVIVIAIIVAITGFAILSLAGNEITLTRIDADNARAFYLAEAGLAKLQETLQNPITGGLAPLLEENFVDSLGGQGGYSVHFVINDSNYYAISTGISGGSQKQIRAKANFLAPPFEQAILAMNKSGTAWTFQLRGTGNPVESMGLNQWDQPVLLSIGGKDQIYGNLFVDGSISLYEQSSINPAPAPNLWELNGDTEASGSISIHDSAYISGDTKPYSVEPNPVTLLAMDYSRNNTHDVCAIFQAAGVTKGYLPAGNALRDVFMKNPSDTTLRKDACATTTVDDYFFEPTSGFVDGTPFTGATPLHMGAGRVYYVNGDLWIYSDLTKGFLIDGQVTIVATGDIHIADNLQYADASSMLGLVALGKYDASGNLISGGNIYFGDPVNGTMGYVSAMMFAANNFLYNTDPLKKNIAEPRTGFTIVGSFTAMNQVSLIRDWYTKIKSCKTEDQSCSSNSECCSGRCSRSKCTSGTSTEARPAEYDTETGQWVDADTGTVLTSTEISALRHYQMIINYDDRVRSQATRPAGLPIGNGTVIFVGFSEWQEL